MSLCLLVQLLLVIVFVLAFVGLSLARKWGPAKLHIRFGVMGAVLALPFIFWGSLFWLPSPAAGTPPVYTHGARWGSLFYYFGWPLTLIILATAEHVGDLDFLSSNYWWAVPLIDFLFVLQWIIWGQLIALTIRSVRDFLWGQQ